MILVCERCKASFLVPASLFNAGARKVRCARCGHVWMTGDQGKKQPPKQAPASAPAPTPPPQPAAAKPGSRTIKRPAATAPRPPLIDWAKLRAIPWQRLSVLAGSIAAGICLLACLTLYFGHTLIIETWPEAQRYYVVLGLAKNPLDDKLVLRHIRSARRYIDGAMRLVVEGEVASHTDKTQVVPAIFVEALGPGEKIIQSWRIEPPAATLKPGQAVPFASAILSPEGAVTEVNLSFVEPPHDEP